MSKSIKVSIIGFLFLFISLIVIQTYTEQKTTKIENIKIKHLNKHIKVKAKIQTLNTHKNNSFLILKESNKTIPAVFFNIDLEKENLEKNQDYFFYGKVELYKQKLQLNLKKIKSVD